MSAESVDVGLVGGRRLPFAVDEDNNRESSHITLMRGVWPSSNYGGGDLFAFWPESQ